MPDASSSSSAATAADADLVARCRRHEPAAQRLLYERLAGPMLVVARRYAPSLADAEDVLQDAFVKVFQRLDDFRGQGSVAGWVRRIVISTSLDAWDRRRVRRTDFDLEDEAIRNLPAADANVFDQMAMAEVRVLIDKLPAGCRHVLLLYTVEGYSHAEIGVLLGVGESASKAQLSRARQRLTALVAVHNRERRPDPATRSPAATAAQPVARATSDSTAAEGGAAFHPVTTLLFQ